MNIIRALAANKYPHLLMVGFLLIYILLPTNNSSVDGWGYACDIKFGEFLFKPHHLLYNVTGWLLLKFLALFSITPDVLLMMKVLNAFAGFGCLIMARKILVGLSVENVDSWIFLIGSSFGVMRFATENETYLIAIFFSLYSGYWMLQYYERNGPHLVLLSGFFASLACLYHQLQIIWYLGLLLILLSHKSFKNSLLFILSGFTVPLAYVLVIVFYEHQDPTLANIFKYVLHDYFRPEGRMAIGVHNVILTPVSFVRTFVQLHGNIFFLIKAKPVYLLPAITGLLLLVTGIMRLRFTGDRTGRVESAGPFWRSIMLIFSLQLFFAFISEGNAEFMVVFAFIVPFLLSRWGSVNRDTLNFLGTGLLIWNVFLGVLPAHSYSYYNHGEIVAFIEEKPNAIYILEDHNIVINRYYYMKGQDISGRVYAYPAGEHTKEICAQQSTGKAVFSDLLSRRHPIDREKILERVTPSDDFKLIRHEREIQSLYGNYYLDRVFFQCHTACNSRKSGTYFETPWITIAPL
jgi:hypothetical protein